MIKPENKCSNCGSKPVRGNPTEYTCGSFSSGDLFISDLCSERKKNSELKKELSRVEKIKNRYKKLYDDLFDEHDK